MNYDKILLTKILSSIFSKHKVCSIKLRIGNAIIHTKIGNITF